MSRRSYKTFTTLDQILALPHSKLPRFALHARGRAFQDECAPYVIGNFKGFYQQQKEANGGDSAPETTAGIAWEKLLFPNNSFCLSVIAQEGTYFVPKGQAPYQASLTFYTNPSPVSMHECTHCEVMITQSAVATTASSSNPVRVFVINPRHHPLLRDFSWALEWDDSAAQRVRGFLGCGVIQQIADDLYDIDDGSVGQGSL